MRTVATPPAMSLRVLIRGLCRVGSPSFPLVFFVPKHIFCSNKYSKQKQTSVLSRSL